MKLLVWPICLVAAFHFVLGVAPAGEAARRFLPLDPGRVWRYEVPNDPPLPIYWEMIVLAKEGDTALVRYELTYFIVEPPFYGIPPVEVRLRERESAIDIELDGQGFVPFYRFDEESFVHRDFDECTDNVAARLSQPSDQKVPAGTFTECVTITYEQRNCSHGGRLYEIWCPGVGLVSWLFDPDALWVLTAFEPAPKPFRRGDANADGKVDLSDPVATLRVLFLGEGYLACEDGADSNDDGRLDISDAIFTLLALFTGGLDIPAPGAETCGFDSTADEIHCASFPPCFERIGD
jgi:hypothetical protein